MKLAPNSIVLAAALTFGGITVATTAAPTPAIAQDAAARLAVSGNTEVIGENGARSEGRAFSGTVSLDGRRARARLDLDGIGSRRFSFRLNVGDRLSGVRVEERPAEEGASGRLWDIFSWLRRRGPSFEVIPVLNDVDANDPTDDDGDATDDGDADDTDANDAVRVLSPRNGEVHLAGDFLDLSVRPANARVSIEGPAERDGDRIRLTGKGAVKIVAETEEGRSEAVTIEATGLVVESIEVLDDIPLRDVSAPHFRAGSSDDADDKVEPAAILQNEALEIRARVRAEKALTDGVRAAIEARDGDLVLKGRLVLGGNNTASIRLESDDALADHVAVNALSLKWSIPGAEGDAAVDLDESTDLRIYTTYKNPRENDIWARTVPVATKLHYELAADWANGASKNIGNGSDSIGYQADNRMRHHVHPDDFKDDTRPFVSAYRPGIVAPFNYEVLPGAWQAKRRGERGISSLYYPPLDVEEDWQDYSHYARNFGWWVLDNPTHTGGRCNQQASLVADILGTLGIEAEVLLLHRVGRSSQTNRPVRMYFASGWNFHGVCNTILEDGTEYCYDGSFSFPPNRKNGTREWAESAPGPFVDGWKDYWSYEDGTRGRVPEWDEPTRWRGIQD